MTYDIDLSTRLRQWHGPFLASLSQLVSTFAHPVVVVILAGLLGLVSGRRRGFGLAALAVLSVTAVEILLKLLLPHPPPGYAGGSYTMLWVWSWELPLFSSYPSGHAARVALLCGLAVRGWSSTPVCALLAMGAGLVTVTNGSHLFSDSLGGVLLGGSAAYLARHRA